MTEDKKSSDWMQKLWRPAMGWMYMLICLLDMAVFPILWSALQAYMKMPITQWNPLTLQGAGLFHIAMGAVLGIAAFGRTQEKLAGTAANPSASTTMPAQNNFGGGMNNGFSNQGGASNSGFNNAPAQGGFGGGSPSAGFGGTAPSGFGAPTQSSFGGGGFGGAPSTTASGFGGGFGNSPAPVATTATGKKVVPDAEQPLL